MALRKLSIVCLKIPRYIPFTTNSHSPLNATVESILYKELSAAQSSLAVANSLLSARAKSKDKSKALPSEVLDMYAKVQTTQNLIQDSLAFYGYVEKAYRFGIFDTIKGWVLSAKGRADKPFDIESAFTDLEVKVDAGFNQIVQLISEKKGTAAGVKHASVKNGNEKDGNEKGGNGKGGNGNGGNGNGRNGNGGAIDCIGVME